MAALDFNSKTKSKWMCLDLVTTSLEPLTSMVVSRCDVLAKRYQFVSKVLAFRCTAMGCFFYVVLLHSQTWKLQRRRGLRCSLRLRLENRLHLSIAQASLALHSFCAIFEILKIWNWPRMARQPKPFWRICYAPERNMGISSTSEAAKPSGNPHGIANADIISCCIPNAAEQLYIHY